MSVRVRTTIAGALAATATFAGCSCSEQTDSRSPPGSTETDPRATVARAARSTLSEPTSELTLRVRGGDAPWTGSGLIELAEGRFRIDATPRSGPRPVDRKEITVVGLGGEGYENTVLETVGGLFARSTEGRRCWFNPHSPVGFFADEISVEEAVRVTGAIVESLRGEVRRAARAGGGFAVVLQGSAVRPRDDFRDRPQRIWGDRKLIADLIGPIVVEVDGTRIAAVSFALRYRPPRDEVPIDRSVRRVAVDAGLKPTNAGLAIDPPACQAIE
jgi:hypothetical protein